MNVRPKYMICRWWNDDIEDNSNNFTRFLIISKTNEVNPTHNKISIIFSIAHTPGSLYSILREFAMREINLTRIESRPTKNIPWEYYFFVDLEGNPNEERILKSLLTIKNSVNFLQAIRYRTKKRIDLVTIGFLTSIPVLPRLFP